MNNPATCEDSFAHPRTKNTAGERSSSFSDLASDDFIDLSILYDNPYHVES